MSKFETTRVVPIPPSARAREIGLPAKKTGQVILDEDLPMLCKIILVAVGGDVMFVGVDDDINLVQGISDGTQVSLVAKKFLTTGTTWQGISGGTTASIITWFGGM